MRPTQLPMQRAFRRRRATLVIAVLASLALVMALGVAWTRSIVQERNEIRAQQHRLQAQYLADAALKRAEARLAADGNYAGETWVVSAAELAASTAAAATIHVKTVENEPNARLIEATARVPDQGALQTQRSRQSKIVLPTINLPTKEQGS